MKWITTIMTFSDSFQLLSITAVQHERAPKMTSVTSSTHGFHRFGLMNMDAGNTYATRHQEGVFSFPMHFSAVTHPFDNFYMPSPYYPHLTESLNLKLGHGAYKPLVTPSNYELDIGKNLSNNLITKTTQNASDPSNKITKDKENEVTSSEELPLMSESFRMKTTHSLYDSATKLLFLSIRWAKSIPSFNQLPMNDQKSLLVDSWAELFIVAAAQWGLIIDGETATSFPFLTHIQNIFKTFAALKIDNFEAACLKALILFRDDTLDGQAPSQQHILLLQNQSLCLLLEKCGGLRFGHLLLLLPKIKFCGNVKRLQVSVKITLSRLVMSLIFIYFIGKSFQAYRRRSDN